MTDSNAPGMTYEVTRNDARLAVSVSGRLDAQTSPELVDEMRGMLDGVTEIIVDLSGLEYMSSAGMRVLLASYKLMMKREGALRVENAQAGVMEVLVISGFASLFGIE